MRLNGAGLCMTALGGLGKNPDWDSWILLMCLLPSGATLAGKEGESDVRLMAHSKSVADTDRHDHLVRSADSVAGGSQRILHPGNYFHSTDPRSEPPWLRTRRSG